MISFDPDALHEANREAERKIRRALAGSGTFRSSLWERYGKQLAIAAAASIAFVGALAWLWWVTA